MKKFVCPVCGYVLEAETMPEGFVCPVCKVPGSKFKVMEEGKLAAEHELGIYEKTVANNPDIPEADKQWILELEQKEAKLKETFFRRLSQKVVQEIERGGNVILSDEDWDDIVQNADIIFNNFTKRLQQTYPSLNKDDLRYCCMVKMQLSQSEMAQIMHLEKDSVKKRLKRIRIDKIGSGSGMTLEELLRNF
jgi:rubredoxin